jgi:hypothetical protein
MSAWISVSWTKAQQIKGLYEKRAVMLLDPHLTPEAYYLTLIAQKEHNEAIFYVAHALPRFEAIVWAGKVFDMLRPLSDLDAEGQQASTLIKRWVNDPDEGKRRACYAFAETMDETTPEKLVLLAIFLSGGSMAPEDFTPVHPKEDITAKLVAAALIDVVTQSGHRETALIKTLEIGERIAQRAES